MAHKIGTLVDQWHRARAEVTKVNKALKKAKDKRDKIAATIQNNFKNEEIHGAMGKLGGVNLNKQSVPSVKDWMKFETWVYRNKALELFQRRLNSSAWRDRVEARKGRPLPGVESYDKYVLTPTKRRS